MMARAVLMEISKTIERAVRSEDPTLFFACFLEVNGSVVYLSNGARPEIQALLPELVRRMSGALPGREDRRARKAIAHDDARLAVERICVEVGTRLSASERLALFVFKNDADCPEGLGVNAFFSSLPDAPALIRAWLARPTA